MSHRTEYLYRSYFSHFCHFQCLIFYSQEACVWKSKQELSVSFHERFVLFSLQEKQVWGLFVEVVCLFVYMNKYFSLLSSFHLCNYRNLKLLLTVRKQRHRKVTVLFFRSQMAVFHYRLQTMNLKNKDLGQRILSENTPNQEESSKILYFSCLKVRHKLSLDSCSPRHTHT